MNFYLKLVSCALIGYILSAIISGSLLRNALLFRIGKKVFHERVRLHQKGVPRLGGIALFLSFYSTLFLFCALRPDFFLRHMTKIMGIFSASLILVGIGVYDDLFKRLSYIPKFLAQVLAVTALITAGYNIETVSSPFGGVIHLGPFGPLCILIWMLVIMNAINLIDGLDGLATGVTVIACLGFLSIVVFKSNSFALLLTCLTIGVALGFLKFNFYPARLFLGDSGSLFLGFLLGLLGLENAVKRSAVVALIVPLITLFMPIASIIFTFSRRFFEGANPFHPDRWHLHYRFMHAGVSHRDTVLIYYYVTFIYAALGIFCSFLPKRYELLMIIFAVVSMLGLYRWAIYFIGLRKKTRRILPKAN